MSNTKTFLTLSLLILLGSMGAIQAQNGDAVTRFELFTTPTQNAREGGLDEAGGAVFLTASEANADMTTAKITLHFSAPLNAGLTATETDGVDYVMVSSRPCSGSYLLLSL